MPTHVLTDAITWLTCHHSWTPSVDTITGCIRSRGTHVRLAFEEAVGLLDDTVSIDGAQHGKKVLKALFSSEAAKTGPMAGTKSSIEQTALKSPDRFTPLYRVAEAAC